MSNLTNSEGNLIQNPESFMKWFGNSVTVDAQGRPKVFYHASHMEFDEFKHKWDIDSEEEYEYDGYDGGNLGIGFYFTDDFKYAKRFGTPRKFYLRINKLLDLTNEENIAEVNSNREEWSHDLMYGTHGEVIDEMCRIGKYDGVIGEGVGGLSYGATEIMVKSPEQIKSAENTGNWKSSANVFESFLGSLRQYDTELIELLESAYNVVFFESFYHGTPDKRNMSGKKGIHIGTEKAATQALESRIGVPADGRWDGTREYGKTLLAGRKRLEELSKERGYTLTTGYNIGSDLPEENYYPTDRKYRAKYSDGSEVPFDATPSIFPVKITGDMKNTTYKPHSDMMANKLMNRFSKSGNARNGYFYKNDAEDEGSISAVVPDTSFIQFESADELKAARNFANIIYAELLDLTPEKLSHFYVGKDDTIVNKRIKEPGYIFVITSRDIQNAMPNKVPLIINICPDSENGNRKASIRLNPNFPVLTFYIDGVNDNNKFSVLLKIISEEYDDVIHELSHLYDANIHGVDYVHNMPEDIDSEAVISATGEKANIKDVAYINSNSERNARLVAAINSVIANGKIDTEAEFIDAVINHPQVKLREGIQNSNPSKFNLRNYNEIIVMLREIYGNLLDF